MRKLLIVFSACLLTVCVSGCKEDIKSGAATGKGDGYTLSIVLGGDETVTKAGVPSSAMEPVDLSEETGVEGLTFSETVSYLDETFYETDSETKGTPVYTENFDALYGNDFYGTAYAPKTGSAQLTDVWGSFLENGGTVPFKKAEAANTYYYDYSKGQAVNLAWPDDGQLMYFFQAPYDAATKNLGAQFYADGSIQFDYTDPAYTSGTAVADAASKHTDILFTSKLVTKPAAGQENRHNLLLYHALTAVKFKFGNVDQEVKTVITKVTIKGITANGKCTIKPTDPATKSSVCSTWGEHSSGTELVVDYSQTFGDVVDYSTGNSSFAASFYDGKSNLNNMKMNDGSVSLMMVPQTKENVEFVVDFTINGKPYQRSVKAKIDWKAGELHTYSLTVNKVDVSVNDTMNEALTEKSGVTTGNTGNVTAYLRAAYSIAWYYGKGDNAIAVAAYQGNGSFIGLEPKDDDGNKMWIKGDDGFYYYRYPVMPGRTTDYPLFTKFTAPTKTEDPPFSGGYLDLMLLLQGVQYDENKTKVTAAWGDVHKDGDAGTTIVSLLETTPENFGR